LALTNRRPDTSIPLGGPMRRLLIPLLLLGLCVSAPAFQANQKGDTSRMVQGTVTDEASKPVNGAIVQLKNVRTLQVRSFVTREDGGYYFHGLDPDTDYTLKADYKDMTSDSRTLSSYDSRKQPVINLQIDKKK
jgi:Carboxypeptidase regulatory-like domain